MRLGTGIGWRPEIADEVAALPGIDWVEVVAENLCLGHLPEELLKLRARGTTVIPHGVALGLGDAERPDEERLRALAERAEALGSPLVTEHIAFVRAGGPRTASPALEAGHLLPVPRTRDALDVLCENVRIAQQSLPVPLAVENIAALVAWPGEEMTEGQFLTELVERTGVRLLIDVANLHTNRVNRGEDPAQVLDSLPLEALAYVHVAGGYERDGVWHDSHAHPVPEPVLEVLRELSSRVEPPGVLLERDENFPAGGELGRELVTLGEAVALGRQQRSTAVGEGPVCPAAVAEGPALADGVAALADGPVGAAPAPTSAVAGVTGMKPDVADAADTATEAARHSLALAETALLSALVARTPVPEGFDAGRLAVQSRALRAKRASVVAKVAPELPEILGESYRRLFLSYADGRPMHGGYRRDALAFAEHLLLNSLPEDEQQRQLLRTWWLDRSGTRPLSSRPLARLLNSARRVLIKR